jgi:hypothetical protein
MPPEQRRGASHKPAGLAAWINSMIRGSLLAPDVPGPAATNPAERGD